MLLGSISTRKYVELLLESFGERLCFPAEFVGRGDMSRGGLMLRCAAEGRELTYTSVVGAVRRGRKPPLLEPLSWKGSPYEFREQIRESLDESSSRSRRRPRPRNLSQIEDESAEKGMRTERPSAAIGDPFGSVRCASANPLTAIRA